MTEHRVDVAVIGGGIIGLSIAWRLSQRGRRVTVLERGEVGRQASWVAAGMLSPAVEVGFEEMDLYRLGRESLRRWPAFAKELEEASGHSVGYCDEGTLVVAVDRDDTEALQRHFRFQQAQGVPVEWLAGFEALDMEPLLAPGLPAAVFSPQDHQVDSRAVITALSKVILEVDEVTLLEGVSVVAINTSGEHPKLMLDDGSFLEARTAVVAAGAWAREVGGIEPQLPIRPVKGQLLSLRMTDHFELSRIVRGPDAYLVPKTDGRLVVGATSEDIGFDSTPTAGAVFRLLEGAVEIVPGVEELELLEASVGFRPASRDHAPLIGWLMPNVLAATGHYRNGILLAPVTADEVAGEVEARLGGRAETSAWLAPFSPNRFAAKMSR